jgi:hypothetical protein
MIAPTQLTVRAEPATGQSFECWLNEGLSTSGTGCLSRYTLTYQASISEWNEVPSLIAHRHGITDPEAGIRLKESELLSWTKNLHGLNTVAGMIFPGIRELTEPEQRNLRNIYRKLYRKV